MSNEVEVLKHAISELGIIGLLEANLKSFEEGSWRWKYTNSWIEVLRTLKCISDVELVLDGEDIYSCKIVNEDLGELFTNNRLIRATSSDDCSVFTFKR